MTTTSPVSPPHPTSGSATGDDTASRAAQLIADNLGQLPSLGPNDQGRMFLFRTFDTTHLPAEMAKVVNTAAQTIGKAIVDLLQLNGIQLLEHDAITPPPPAEPPAAIARCAHGHRINLTPQQLAHLKADH